MYIYKLLK